MVEATRDPSSTSGAANTASPGAFDGAGPDELRLPECEDEPVGMSSRQAVVMFESAGCLLQHWRGRQDVFVTADIFVYWHRKKPPVSPDVLVARGVAYRHRRSYVVWEEGRPPDFVLEVSAPSGGKRNGKENPHLYAEMGVPEYFWYDPEGKSNPAFTGFELRDGRYAPLPEETVAEGVVGIRSKVLGMCLCIKPGPHVFDSALRFYDLAAGEFLPTHHELVEEHRRLEEDVRRLEERRRRLEEDVRRLEERRRRLEERNRLAATEARVAELEALIENEKMQRG